MLRALFILAMAAMVGCAAPERAPRAFYFASAGDDHSGDGTFARPFRSIDNAANLSLASGDRLFFKGGDIFRGNLHIRERSVQVTSFGEGRATLQAGEGNAIIIQNAGNVLIENLVLVGNGRESNRGCGIAVINDNVRGRIKAIVIRNVEARSFGVEGILMKGGQPENGFEDVEITRCNLWDNAQSGIFISGDRDKSGGWSFANVRISACTAHHNTGDPRQLNANRSGSGIFLTGVDGAIVDRCVAYENGALSRSLGGGPVAIWASESNRVVIQNCQAYRNHTGGRHDGGGFALDGGMTNSILQYNYSHDNEGSGFGLYNYAYAGPWHDNICRYNVSENDGLRNQYPGIHIWDGNLELARAWIYHNTVITGPTGYACFWIQSQSIDVRAFNNIFLSRGNALLMDVADGQRGLILQGNCYWNDQNNIRIDWLMSRFASFDQWRRASGQERQAGFSKDPLLAGEGDGLLKFVPRDGSPVLDKAQTIPADPGPQDARGARRVTGPRADIGALER